MKASLFSTLLLLLASALAAPPPAKRKSNRNKLIPFADATSSIFPVKRSAYTLVKGSQGKDGFFLTTDAQTGSLTFEDIVSGHVDTFVELWNVKDEAGNKLNYYNFESQPSRGAFGSQGTK